MAQDNYARKGPDEALSRLAGTLVELHGVDGPFRLCGICGHDHARVSRADPPHAASLKCNSCSRHISWLSRDHVAAMSAQRGAA